MTKRVLDQQTARRGAFSHSRHFSIIRPTSNPSTSRSMMQPGPRRLNHDTVYVAEAPLRQKTFSSRKQTRRSLASSTLTAVQKKKQQTLTQIKFPIYLSEDDSDEGGHRPREQKRAQRSPPGKTEESDGDFDQPLRHKRRRVSLEPTTLRSSNSTARRSLNVKEQGQKTLTQAGYLLREGLGEVLDSDDDTFEIYDDSDNHEAYDAKEESIKTKILAKSSMQKGCVQKKNVEVAQSEAPGNPMTPRHRKTLEVPSSQSPADVPLSTQSSRYCKDIERSPLRERSTNIRSARAHTSTTKAYPNFVTDNRDGKQASSQDSPSLVLIKGSQVLQNVVVEDSEDEELAASSVSLKTVLADPVCSGKSQLTDHGCVSLEEDTWNHNTPFSALPQPRWSQLEHRDVTQYVRSQASTADGPTAQLLEDIWSAGQRGSDKHLHPELHTKNSGQYSEDIVRQSQVSTVGTTQPTPRTQSTPRPFSSPPRTSPPLQHVSTGSQEGESIEIQVPSSPQPMLPPSRKAMFSDQTTEESQRRVTFSQLVPQSLRDTWYSRPPIWTQEDDEL